MYSKKSKEEYELYEVLLLERTSLNFNNAQPYLDIQQFVSTIRERQTERVWFGSVWFGLV